MPVWGDGLVVGGWWLVVGGWWLVVGGVGGGWWVVGGGVGGVWCGWWVVGDGWRYRWVVWVVGGGCGCGWCMDGGGRRWGALHCERDEEHAEQGVGGLAVQGVLVLGAAVRRGGLGGHAAVVCAPGEMGDRVVGTWSECRGVERASERGKGVGGCERRDRSG